MTNAPTMVCSTCGTTKPADRDHFSIIRRRLSHTCRECMNRRSREYQSAIRDQLNALIATGDQDAIGAFVRARRKNGGVPMTVLKVYCPEEYERRLVRARTSAQQKRDELRAAGLVTGGERVGQHSVRRGKTRAEYLAEARADYERAPKGSKARKHAWNRVRYWEDDALRERQLVYKRAHDKQRREQRRNARAG